MASRIGTTVVGIVTVAAVVRTGRLARQAEALQRRAQRRCAQ